MEMELKEYQVKKIIKKDGFKIFEKVLENTWSITKNNIFYCFDVIQNFAVISEEETGKEIKRIKIYHK